MNPEIIRQIESEQFRTDIPEFNIGDTVRVYITIKEGSGEKVRVRTQMFEGVVTKRQNGGINENFTVRRVAYGVGAEKTWPIHCPDIQKIEVIRKGKVRRAKLYYLRDRVGKAAKVKEKI